MAAMGDEKNDNVSNVVVTSAFEKLFGGLSL